MGEGARAPAGETAAAEPPRVRRSAAARAPWLLAGLVVLLMAAAVPLGELAHQDVVAAGVSRFTLIAGLVAVGAVVASRPPRHPIGWILLLIALFLALNAVMSSYTIAAYRDHRDLPAGWLAVILQPSWAPAIVLFGLVIVRFPDGTLPSRRWWALLAAYLAIGSAWTLGAFAIAVRAVVEGSVRITPSGDLAAIARPAGATAWWGTVQDWFFPALALVVLVWMAAQVPGYRRSGEERRAQLEWLIGGAATAATGGLIAVAAPGTIVSEVAIAAVVALPVSVGVASMRYRLYEIDVIIRRTLVYATLVAALALIHLGGVYLIGHAVQAVTGRSGAFAVTISTLAVVVGFQPLRSRIRRAVDRRFFREAYDSARTLDAFVGRMRGQIDLDSLQADILAIASATVKPRTVSLWQRPVDRLAGHVPPGDGDTV